MGLFDKLRGKDADRANTTPTAYETGATHRPAEPEEATGFTTGALPGEDEEAPGWDAITEALDGLYPRQPEPAHFAAAVPMALGGNDPLVGISAYRALDPVPHWHYVTYGYTELYDNETPDEEDSGFGFEMTFRLADEEAGEPRSTPPTWPVSMLQNLARYVFDTGKVFAPGHFIKTNGPIAKDHETPLRGLAFCEDPELGTIGTPHGRVQFVQAIGITAEELADCASWDTLALLALLDAHHPRGVTDLDRETLSSHPEAAAAVSAGIDAEGPDTGAELIEHLVAQPGRPPVLEVGANAVESLARVLAGRIGAGEHFQVIGPEQTAWFEPAEGQRCDIEVDDDGVTVRLTPEVARRCQETLRAERGDYTVPGLELVIRVVPSEIRDADGEVTEVIG